MTDNLKTLLEYQQFDIKLHRILDSIKKSAASKKMDQARTEYGIAKKVVMDSEKEAENVVAIYMQTVSQIKSLSEKVGEFQLVIENAEPEDNLASVAESLESLKSKLYALEKKLLECRASCERLLKAFQDASNRGEKIRAIFAAAKAEYDRMIKESEPEVRELRRKMKEFEPKLDPELFEKYKSITADNKFPAFVEVYVGDGEVCSCRGCGLQLSQKNTSTLNENGCCTCETCRRIIYKN